MSDIKTRPGTREFREGWDRAHAQDPKPADTQRIVRPHDCERCGHHMQYDDQSCACTARDPWLK